MENVYTFKELKDKYNWNTTTAKIADQIKYAKSRGVLIELAKKQGTTYFRILEEYDIYTIEELVDKYGASEYIKIAPPSERENYFKTRGILLENVGRQGSTNMYRILTDYSDRTFTWDELCNRYPYLDKEIVSPKRESYALSKGLMICQSGTSKRISYYTILDGDNYQWDSFEQYPDLEFCKEGYIRNKKTKRIYNAHNSCGYIQIRYKDKLYLAHRLLMLVYKPILNADQYTVDHINGKRDDNWLVNLRWVTLQENLRLKDINRQKIQEKINECLQLVGYDTLIEEIDNLLKKLKNF